MGSPTDGLELKQTEEFITTFDEDFLTWNNGGVTIYCRFDADVPPALQNAIMGAVNEIQKVVNVTFDFEQDPPISTAPEITFRMDQAGYYDLTTYVPQGHINLHDAIGITFWSANPDAPLSGRPTLNDEGSAAFLNPVNYIDGKVDIAFDTAWVTAAPAEAFAPGGLLWHTVLHEVGHAMGLRHSQLAAAEPLSNLSEFEAESGVYTIMASGLSFHVAYYLPTLAPTGDLPNGVADTLGILGEKFVTNTTPGIYDLVALQDNLGC
jgi:hypothetical protein